MSSDRLTQNWSVVLYSEVIPIPMSMGTFIKDNKESY